MAVFVIMLEGAGLLALWPAAKGPAYQTASQEGLAAEGATVLVIFAPDATAQAISDLLQRRKATIVDGPRGGFYRLRIGDKTMTQGEIDAALAALRAEPALRTVLPAPRPK